MIQVKLHRADSDGREDFVDFGQPVATLEEARLMVKALDIIRAHGLALVGFEFYTEDTEILAVDTETGKEWEYADQDPTGYTDGVWFGD